MRFISILLLAAVLLVGANTASAQVCYCADGQPCICTNGQCYCADRSAPAYFSHPGGTLHVFLRQPASFGVIRYSVPAYSAYASPQQSGCVWTGSGWDCSGNAGNVSGYGFSSRDNRHIRRAQRRGYSYYSY